MNEVKMEFLKKIEGYSKTKADDDALIFFDGKNYKRYSFKKIWVDVCAIAKSVKKGSISVIVADCNYETFIKYLGNLAGQGVPAFYSPLTTRQDAEIYNHEFKKITEYYDGKSLIKDFSYEMEMNGFIQFSSGTTGLRKAVLIDSEKLAIQLESLGQSLKIKNTDKVISWLPVYHDMGLISSFFMPLYFGIPVVHIEPVMWSFKPSLLHQAIEEEKGTISWQPNFAFRHILSADQKQKINYSLSTVRKMVSCSEPCRVSVFDEYLTRFSENGLDESALQTSYALAENVFAATLSNFKTREDWLSLNGYISSGNPLAHSEILIYSSTETEEFDDSEIYVAGHCVVDGYVGLPSTDFNYSEKGVRQFKTRDKGLLKENQLFVYGRIDDTIVVNGKKVFAHEIEREVNQFPKIKLGRVLAALSEKIVDVAIYYEGRLEESEELEIRKLIKSKYEISIGEFIQLPAGFLIKTSSGKIARKKSLEKINNA